MNLKIELQKVRSTLEKEIKKLKKVNGSYKNGGVNLTTQGSNGGDTS